MLYKNTPFILYYIILEAVCVKYKVLKAIRLVSYPLYLLENSEQYLFSQNHARYTY